MSLRRTLFSLLCLLALAALAAFVACGGTTSADTITPITGVVIRAETLTTGRGCGAAPGQVFKYAAVVYARSANATPAVNEDPNDTHDTNLFGQPLTANVYDCFTDGTFVQLPQTNNSLTYRLELYIYDQPAYAAAASIIGGATDDVATALSLDPAAIVRAQQAIGRLRATSPVWTTTCGATQQQDVEVLAICDPIAFGLAGLAGVASDAAGPTALDLATSTFALADGGTATCDPGDGGAPDDAGDAATSSTDAASDAEAGASDASAGVDASGASTSPLFRTVRVTTSGATTDVTCPDHFHLDQLTPVTTVSLDVTLLRSDGSTLGKTTCSALTRLGETSSATCGPVQ